jgi:methionine-rich copper-binding protein CopC
MIRVGTPRRLSAVLALLVLTCLPLRPAEAHAILVESTPAANATVSGPSVPLTLRYNSRIDKHRSKLTLVRPDKTTDTLAIAQDGPEDLLTATADLAPGDYRLRWQVLAIDGHITRGEVVFTVTGPTS